MKIALVNAYYHPNVFGGAEISVQNLAEALARMGHDVCVVSSSPNGGNHSDRFNDVDVHYLDAAQWGKSVADSDRNLADRVLWHLSAEFNPRPAGNLVALLNDLRPDVVHTNCITSFSAKIFPAIRRAGIPIVHTLRDYYLLCPLTTMHRNGANCERRCVSCAAFSRGRRNHSEFVSSVVGVSRWILDRHLAFGLFERASEKAVIYNSYEAPPAGGQKERTTAEGGLRLGYIGRLHPTKGIESLLEAVRGLPLDAWTLDIAGSGRNEYEAQLKTTYESERVRFLGWQETATFFESIDVLVVPSTWHEPMARAILEACAHGVPVVASATGGIPELVKDGRTGWLFEAGNSDSLRATLNRFVSQPETARDMQANCLEKAKRFRHEEMARRYIDVYETTLARGN